MTTPVLVKLISANSKAAFDTALAAYIAGAGSGLATDNRAMAMATMFNPETDAHQIFAAFAHGGDDTPASKVADQQFIMLEDDDLAALQTALDTAIADAAHHVNATGNADTNAGDINVTGNMFQATDVGRKITIAGNVRTITAFVSATRVTYSGAAITGTSLSVTLHGAETVQDINVSVHRDRDGDIRYAVLLAVEGQLE